MLVSPVCRVRMVEMLTYPDSATVVVKVYLPLVAFFAFKQQMQTVAAHFLWPLHRSCFQMRNGIASGAMNGIIGKDGSCHFHGDLTRLVFIWLALLFRQKGAEKRLLRNLQRLLRNFLKLQRSPLKNGLS